MPTLLIRLKTHFIALVFLQNLKVNRFFDFKMQNFKIISVLLVAKESFKHSILFPRLHVDVGVFPLLHFRDRRIYLVKDIISISYMFLCRFTNDCRRILFLLSAVTALKTRWLKQYLSTNKIHEVVLEMTS